MTRLITLAMCAGLVTAAGAQYVERSGSDSLERNFAPQGKVQLDLSAGDYTIQAGREDRIFIRWRTGTMDQLRDVRVTADVRGGNATITTDGPHNNFHVTIELPARTDLHVRMSAGDLDVAGFEGNKDIELRAGDLSIDVGQAEAYGMVDTSVTFGDLDARPWQVSKGGIWRKFNWQGKGPYKLHAHLMAGDLILTSRSRDKAKN
jgi:hypothetical protein